MKLKTVLTAAIISGILMGCSSSDNCEEILPPITPPTPPVEQFITLNDTQVKMATRTLGFTNAEVQGPDAIQTMPIIKEHEVLEMKKVDGYTLLLVQEDGIKNIYIAKGNGSKHALIKENAVDHYQFDTVFFPNTLHNDTQFVVVFDQYDQKKITRYDADLNLVDSIKLNTYDTVYIGTNSYPTMHDVYMTIPVRVGMDNERQIFKYNGDRHQGWRIEDSEFVLGIAGDGDLVYSVRYFDNGEKYRISYIGEDSIVHDIGVISRKNVNTIDIRANTTHGRFVSLNGNTIDVLNKQILTEPTCSFEPFSGVINLNATEDYYMCPADLGYQGAGVMSYERYDAATGERDYIQLSRPGKPTRHSAESVTFAFDDYGMATYTVQDSVVEVDNVIDIVK